MASHLLKTVVCLDVASRAVGFEEEWGARAESEKGSATIEVDSAFARHAKTIMKAPLFNRPSACSLNRVFGLRQGLTAQRPLHTLAQGFSRPLAT